MSRIINTDSPGKRRNQQLRTCAELLRHLSQKQEIDDDAKDMLAQLVFSLREINETIEHSAEVWEGRNYWMKAEELRNEWRWAFALSSKIEGLLRNEAYDKFPEVMVELMKQVGNVNVKKFTRPPETWQNAYKELMKE
jgi:hypothetical protein